MQKYKIKLYVQALLEEWISTRTFNDKFLVQVLMMPSLYWYLLTRMFSI